MSVRTIIVDDSPTMRAIIAGLLRQDPQIDVIGTAANAAEARIMIRERDPDVVTLDIEMPGMNGIDFLDKIMSLRPTPVVMLSSHTAKGAEATLRALSLGAVDCYAKPAGRISDLLDSDAGRLAQMVKAAASCKPKLQGRTLAQPSCASAHAGKTWNGRIIAIAASTGGVEALNHLLGSFPVDCPPTIIVQHMPAGYTTMLARSLDRAVAPKVVEARHNMTLEPGHIYIAPAGPQHCIIKGRNPMRCVIQDGDPVNGHRPSADRLFTSLAGYGPSDAVGVILTGMGDDGARGLTAMHAAGLPTIGQNAETSLIYGMPRAAADMGGLDDVLPLSSIAARLMELCSC
jgi:two-component system, chemotaxis family, protein-glutamate methylesterase/glutaminase